MSLDTSQMYQSAIDKVKADLKCPDCMKYLEPPIFVCHSGHPACTGCLQQQPEKKCSFCDEAITSNRNLWLESFLQDWPYPCRIDGCDTEVQLKFRQQHEDSCNSRLFKCISCDLRLKLPAFRNHLRTSHILTVIEDFSDPPTLTIGRFSYLYVDYNGELFALDTDAEGASPSMSVFYFGPKSRLADLICTVEFGAVGIGKGMAYKVRPRSNTDFYADQCLALPSIQWMEDNGYLSDDKFMVKLSVEDGSFGDD